MEAITYSVGGWVEGGVSTAHGWDDGFCFVLDVVDDG
jgi:hypothetical protein